MYKSTALFGLLAGVMAGSAAIAKLPPTTPEEQAAAAAKKTQEAAQLEKEKALLERAQDRIAKRYGNARAGAPAGGKTRDQNMPKTASELPRGVGPTPQRSPSGEAHSAPAK